MVLHGNLVYGNSTGVCHYQGDPHLLPFPLAPGEPRTQYWCKATGEQLLLKNNLIEFIVDSTDPYWRIKSVSNQQFGFLFRCTCHF